MAESLTIPRFLRRLRGGHRWWNLGLVAVGHALVGAVVLCLVDLLVPRWLGWAALAAAAWLVAVCSVTAVRLQAPMRQADRELGLRDRLLTYIGLQRTPAAGAVRSGAFAAWLEEDLEERLAAIPESVASGLWRRPLGRLRYLVPLLVLLLLLREFAPLPIRPDDRGPPISAHGGGGGGAASPDESESGSEKEPESKTPPPPPELAPEPETPPPPEPGDEEPVTGPPPDLDVNVVDHFVIPQFVGEGETRLQMAKLALLGEGESGGPTPQSRAGGAPDAPPPPRDVTEYEKAYERALRARHVPPAERPFVRTYFEALLEAVR